MPRPPTDESGAAKNISIRLSPHHTNLLDSFVRPDRNRSQTIAKLLERADEGRKLKEPLNEPTPPAADPIELFANLGIHPTMKGPNGERITADGKWIHPIDAPGPTRRPADGSPPLPYDRWPNYRPNEATDT